MGEIFKTNKVFAILFFSRLLEFSPADLAYSSTLLCHITKKNPENHQLFLVSLPKKNRVVKVAPHPKLEYSVVYTSPSFPFILSSNAVKAALAPSPIAITICLNGTTVTSPAA